MEELVGLPALVLLYMELNLSKRPLTIAAITVEYLKAKIINISKPYLQNLPAYYYSRAAFTGKRSDL
jgi:hypothetical protein